ncbi:MAG: trypsin-like serine protease [Methylobacter sp.]|uniref:Trypsin-like serine protease n=1 Tax=Candidatus Methylobacter titanis TaxID=3053457 RepID=A0AA43Q1W7_9GAMM|nr:trypsin-like serine protease [Candidatus Methylobacter titanis]
MVTTVTSYTDSRNRANPGEGYDGVVRISSGGYFGTGVLLYDGRAILTAAHLFASASSSSADIHFETASGQQKITSSRIEVMPDYDSVNANNDLALVWLTSAAPVGAERYGLYRDSDEIGQSLTMVGYGLVGSGDAGTLATYSGGALRMKANNQFDADAAMLKSWLGSSISWTPTAGTQLLADFDNGMTAQDALGRLINSPGTGLGQNEGMIAQGDSGGPAFIRGQVAGIATYNTSISQGSVHPDVDGVNNSSFGEIGAWQRISHYQQWIDQSLRAQYPNAPTQADQVQKTVTEGNSGTSYAYFLLQFTGMRSDTTQILSVDYATRDDTARAGEDYLAAKGTLALYPNENQAVIPVEIIGDTFSEPDESFYLDIFNPIGGSFGAGVLKLTAIRTIVNDDGNWG